MHRWRDLQIPQDASETDERYPGVGPNWAAARIGMKMQVIHVIFWCALYYMDMFSNIAV